MNTIPSRICQWLPSRIGVAIAVLALGLIGASSLAADISYVYDDAGRLRAVIDPASDTAVYTYDPVGNLTGITRQPSSTLAVLQFTPSSSPIGTTVTIYGTAFSATPASNTVKFNGTTATVLTASTTVLTATVPSGATTGAISVTVGANTAASSTAFTVGSGAPTLANFNPAVGNYGATITLTGTNYDTTPINNRVAFTAAMGAVATATATTITVPVPSTAQTGPISVSTIQGKATSSQEFFVAPPGIVTTDVQYTGRITVDGPTVVASITTANKNGLMVFDGTVGQRINLGFSAVTIAQFNITVYRPDGVITTGVITLNTGGGAMDVGVLPMSGTYTIFIDPANPYTGTVTVTASTELSGTITPGGAAIPISISRIGQNARLTFSGTAGQTVSAGLMASTIPFGSVSLIKPDGSTLAGPVSFNTSGGVMESQVLPTAGPYAILVDPYGTNTGNVTLQLYNQPDVTGTITIDGATVTSTLTVPGQRARYTFAGTAGQWVNLGLTAVTISSSTVSLLKPDGTTLISSSFTTSGGSLDPTTTLPTTGTYTIVVDPNGLATGSMTLTLTTPVTGTIMLDGASVPISLTKAGRTARYTFSGTSGQWVSLGMTAVTISSGTVTLLNPNGTTLQSTSVTTSGGGLEPPSTLPTTGTYTIVIDPSGTNTGTITLKLMSYLSGTLNLNGAATTSTISIVGQNARYTFSGTVGQWVSLGMTGVTISSSAVSLFRPDGTSWTSVTVGTTGGNLDPPTALPTTGTYTVTINPSGASTGSMTLTLSTEVTGTLTINAAATPVTLGRAGQNARYTFNGTSGQQVTVRVTGNTIGNTTVNLYAPTGSLQTTNTSAAASFNLPTVILGSTGTYTATVNPTSVTTGSLTLQVTSP
jgi:YD repeat-containing protein